MPAKRLSVMALRRAKASAGVCVPRSDKVAAAASQLTSLSVTDGAFHLAGGHGTGDEQRQAYKNGTFQQASLILPASLAGP